MTRPEDDATYAGALRDLADVTIVDTAEGIEVAEGREGGFGGDAGEDDDAGFV